ncbi:MAG: diguanylate cyclase [Methylococcales bacterium]
MAENSTNHRLKQQFNTKELLFIENLPSTLSTLIHAWQHKTHLDAPAFKALIANAQQLAAHSQAAGFLDVAEIAQALTETLTKTDVNLVPLLIHSESTLEMLMAALETAAHNLINHQHSYNPYSRRASDAPLVFLLGITDQQTKAISCLLNDQGIHTMIIPDSQHLLPEIESHKPVALLINFDSSQAHIDLSYIEWLKQSQQASPAIVILARQDDMHARLSAAHAGAAAYFVSPIPTDELVDFIHSQQLVCEQSVYRVLIINDDRASAEGLRLVMQQNGIKTSLLSQPENLLEALIDFQPELVLIDLHLREFNGLEMAANIRQHYAYSSTSIVFWADEQIIEEHRHVLLVAGEDFFVKSMTPDQLIAAIETKVKRSRIIQEMMVRDGLTGLLNRTTLDDHLQQVTSKNRQHKYSFSYVMLDLDHFSHINEQFGYQIGDEVLKAWGALFNRRLRAVDTAARFGGEVVALILPNTTATQAKLLVGELLRKFSALKFGVHQREFSVTFSAGIAEFPQYHDIATLIDAANQALYQAKSEGRNRVKLSNH